MTSQWDSKKESRVCGIRYRKSYFHLLLSLTDCYCSPSFHLSCMFSKCQDSISQRIFPLMSILADRDDDNPLSWLPQPLRSLGQGSCDVQIGTKYRDCHLVCLKATSAQIHFSDLTLQTTAVSGSPQHSHTQHPLSALVVPRALGAMKCLPK